MADRFVTVKYAAEFLGVSVRTVWRMVADGQLEVRRVRGCTRLAMSGLLNYLEQGCKGQMA
jgi:excisionase family DNA binding protein